jgi:nitrilase
MYVISCGMPLRKEDIPDHYKFKQRYYQEVGEWINEGDSAIVDPEGEFIAGPLNRQESLLYAEVDLAKVQGARRMLDVAGHYARPDVFQLTVNRDTRRIIEKSSEQ